MNNVYLTNIIFGNTVKDYLTAFLILVIFVVVFKFIQWLLLKKLARIAKKTKTDIDDTFISIIKSLRPGFYYLVSLFFAVKFLILSDFVERFINRILLIFIIYQSVIAVQILIDYVIDKKLKTEDDEENRGVFKILGNIAKWGLWVIGALMILSNLGINITSLIAGLGIGGIAIALALQNILTDLFSSFSIYFDKPFQVGDFIIVGKHSGTVEKIGIKTTRIRANQGEEIVISNQELTSARVQNFKKMKERRIVTKFGIIYETPNEKLRKVPEIIESIIKSEKKLRFNRMLFIEFADSALVFELVYYVLSNEYSVYLNLQQEINFKIKERFEKEGINMAYPTQTVYILK